MQEGNVSDQMPKALASLGCTYAGANPGYVALDVPPSVHLAKVRQYLIEHGAQWEHADPRYEELFPDEA